MNHMLEITLTESGDTECEVKDDRYPNSQISGSFQARRITESLILENEGDLKAKGEKNNIVVDMLILKYLWYI